MKPRQTPLLYVFVVLTKVSARRVSSRPMDAHFWNEYKENSLNL